MQTRILQTFVRAGARRLAEVILGFGLLVTACSGEPKQETLQLDAVPEFFRAAIPPYPGATAQSGAAASNGGPGASSWSGHFTTTDTPKTAAAYYANSVKRAGFVINEQDDQPSTSVFTAWAGAARIKVFAFREGSQTDVQILLDEQVPEYEWVRCNPNDPYPPPECRNFTRPR